MASSKTTSQIMVDMLTSKNGDAGNYRKLILIITIILITSIVFLYYFNKMVTLRVSVDTEWAKMKNSLQLRQNLFPVLLHTMSSFVRHEDNVFTYTAGSRNMPSGSEIEKKVKKLTEDAKAWPKVLDRLVALAESYPDLKVSEGYQLLMTKVTDTEMEIFNRRLAYNEAVNKYNTYIRTYPQRIIVFLFSHHPIEFFEGSGEVEWRLDMLAKSTGDNRDEVPGM